MAKKRWCSKTNKWVDDFPGKQQGRGDAVGKGNGPFNKQQMQRSGMNALKKQRDRK